MIEEFKNLSAYTAFCVSAFLINSSAKMEFWFYK